MRVLIIDDDPDISDFLQTHLPAEGFAVDCAQSGIYGLELVQVNEYDLVILDLSLPDIAGERVCTEIRRIGRSMPVLVLSVILDTESKAKLLDAGADDYLCKPFSFDELRARMHALLRRPQTLLPDILRTSDLSLDSLARTAWRGKRDLDLTPKEFALLQHLMRGRGSVVSKSELIEHAWDDESDPFSDSIETHMVNLRRKIGSPALIHTLRGKGYRLNHQV